MIWQDWVIAVASVVFGYALIYQVYQGFKEKKGFLAIQTSATTALGLYAVSFAFFTLDLFFSTGTTLFNAVMWSILLVQRLIYQKV